MRASMAAMAASVLTACFPLLPGDGAFRVAGQVSSGIGGSPTCSLHLLDPTRREAPLHTVSVTGSFMATFMVPPTRNTYEVDLNCGGKVLRVVTIKYGTEVRYDTPVDLGNFVL